MSPIFVFPCILAIFNLLVIVFQLTKIKTNYIELNSLINKQKELKLVKIVESGKTNTFKFLNQLTIHFSYPY